MLLLIQFHIIDTAEHNIRNLILLCYDSSAFELSVSYKIWSSSFLIYFCVVLLTWELEKCNYLVYYIWKKILLIFGVLVARGLIKCILEFKWIIIFIFYCEEFLLVITFKIWSIMFNQNQIFKYTKIDSVKYALVLFCSC